ncbi:hypothetical protein BU17DRAFT_87481 [Hysterangium stoloniferum]|nr:hypothetical protein BU17DRAFT_87481 [Hysterangium stoloniferum]
MPSYVVVGASRGIGREFVRQLSAAAENTVFALVRSKMTALSAPSTVLNENRHNVHIIEADVTDVKAMRAAAEEVAKITGGGLDVLIENAAAINGENDWRRIIDFDGEDEILQKEFDNAFKVNVMGVIYSALSFLPLLRIGKTRKIIVISSQGGNPDFVYKAGLTGMSAYGTSKAGTNMVVAKLALELQGEGFVVVGLSPGLVDTSRDNPLPRSPKNMEWLVACIKNFREKFPQSQGMLSVDVSVEKQLKLIAECTVKDNGHILG